jgi:cell division protein FtsI (penicillin-binding protein 3)
MTAPDPAARDDGDPGDERRAGPAHTQTPARTALDIGRSRLTVGAAFFVLAFGAIAVRLVDVAMLQTPETKKSAPPKTGTGQPPSGPLAGATPQAPLAVQRGEIVDRNGVLLATNILTYSLYADPKLVIDAKRTAAQLGRMFPDLERERLEKRLAGEGRHVLIRRHLTPREYRAVIAAGLTGITAQKDRRRVYPYAALVAHAVGMADVDSNGIAGIEARYQAALAQGRNVALSIDVRIQDLMREELQAAVKQQKAIGAAGALLDIKTGEIVAMVSLPDFDPHDPGAVPEAGRFNRVTLGMYEMGSTFKIFNTAMALDARTATLAKVYDARGPLVHGTHRINDFHGLNRAMTVAEIFQFSSNIGSAKMAMEAGTARQREYMERFGMLKPVPVELPEVGAPLFPRDWKPINTITISYGHGISVSPLHLVAAVGGIVNDGRMARTTVLKRKPGAEIPFDTVVRPETAAALRQIMRLVVEKGTGKRAEAAGFLVGGKTGTADKSAGKRGYNRASRLSSFVGAFPIHEPRYAILVMIDEPKGTPETGGQATGGLVAAPVVREIVLKAAPLLGVMPVDEPKADGPAPKLERAIAPATPPKPRDKRQ